MVSARLSAALRDRLPDRGGAGDPGTGHRLPDEQSPGGHAQAAEVRVPRPGHFRPPEIPDPHAPSGQTAFPNGLHPGERAGGEFHFPAGGPANHGASLSGAGD